ncbi:MoaD/ThiS family protein [Flavobacterium qiangtangense]|uniref:MoaD/ThiS family protein n=1 Tax=Flavobacterium qiangtangense TaxID=1442595 RepID=A0ABW1PIW9_9FLAO
MEIKIIAFGQIAEITGKEITLEASDIDSLKIILSEKFPALSDRKFAIAVNKKLNQVNLDLKQNDTVALMPPYSGG